jgi:hypothetical protein
MGMLEGYCLVLPIEVIDQKVASFYRFSLTDR